MAKTHDSSTYKSKLKPDCKAQPIHRLSADFYHLDKGQSWLSKLKAFPTYSKSHRFNIWRACLECSMLTSQRINMARTRPFIGHILDCLLAVHFEMATGLSLLHGASFVKINWQPPSWSTNYLDLGVFSFPNCFQT